MAVTKVLSISASGKKEEITLVYGDEVMVAKSSFVASPVTGTLVNTVVATSLISAGKILNSDYLKLELIGIKGNTTGSATYRVYLNTSANLSGSPILLSTMTINAANNIASMTRSIMVFNSGNFIYILNPSVAAFHDYVSGSYSGLTPNISIDQYLIVAIQISAGSESAYLGGFNLFKK